MTRSEGEILEKDNETVLVASRVAISASAPALLSCISVHVPMKRYRLREINLDQ